MSDTEEDILERMGYYGGQRIWNRNEVRDDTGMDCGGAFLTLHLSGDGEHPLKGWTEPSTPTMQESAGIPRGPEPWRIRSIVWASCHLFGCLQVRTPFIAGTMLRKCNGAFRLE